MIQSRRVHDHGKASRAKPKERCRTPFAYRPSRQRLQRRGVPSDVQKWTTRGTAETTTMPTVRWPTELWTGPEHPSSGAARCLEGRGEIFLSTCEDTACVSEHVERARGSAREQVKSLT